MTDQTTATIDLTDKTAQQERRVRVRHLEQQIKDNQIMIRFSRMEGSTPDDVARYRRDAAQAQTLIDSIKADGPLGKVSRTVKPCNARCTSATGPNCDCACAGRRHGEDNQISA